MVSTGEATRYEIILEKDAREFRVMFSARRGKRALADALFAIPHPRRLEIFDALATDAAFAWNAKAGEYATADGCKLRFSGRTERDVKNVR